MNTKAKRPALFDLDNLLVKPAIQAEPLMETADPAPAPVAPKRSTVKAAPIAAETFRTSVYFSRTVHDKLREIAFQERKSITDLINEGLDHVLAKRNYASTTELKSKKH